MAKVVVLPRIENVVTTYYDALNEKKLMGLRCKGCGHYSFPPKPTCNKCGSRELEWVEMSGRGKLQIYTVANYPGGEFQAVAPYAFGLVMLDEGTPFSSLIDGVDLEDPWAGNQKLPIDVFADVRKIGTKTVVVFKTTK